MKFVITFKVLYIYIDTTIFYKLLKNHQHRIKGEYQALESSSDQHDLVTRPPTS